MVCESRGDAMSKTRKLAAILAADMVGYSRLAAADEDRTLARLRALRSDPALGRPPEARSEARRGLAISPTLTISGFRASVSSDDPTVTAGLNRIIDGLRKGGAPEE